MTIASSTRFIPPTILTKRLDRSVRTIISVKIIIIVKVIKFIIPRSFRFIVFVAFWLK